MAKLTLTDVSSSRLTSIATINSNNGLIEAALEKTLSRDGTSPNQMEADLDFNSNWGINLREPLFNHHAATKQYVDNLVLNQQYPEGDSSLIQGLQDQIEDNDADILARATITYVDSVSATLTTAIATSETTIRAEYQAADTTLQTDINTRATITYVDTSIATVNSAIATSESTIRAEYQGADAIIRTVNSNLLQNPSGVDGLNGWTNTTNWSTGTSGLGSYIITTTAGVQTINSVAISTTVGEAYAFQFRAGGITFTAGAMNVIWRDSGGSTVRTDTISITSQEAYPLYSNSFAAPATSVDCIVQFTANVSSGFFLFNKVKVEQASAVTMFTDDIFFVNSLASITTNATAIASNSGSIATLTTDVSANTTSIAANGSSITTNTANISTNASAITTNTAGIATLNTTVSTNTASISTNATAITTVDGKLSASYGLTVDGNGRIAQMKLLSDGTTSSVRFKADTFKIFDGSSNDIAPFSVSGGVVSMTNVDISGSLIVDGTVVTGKIDDNAITNVETNLVEGNISQTSENTWFDVISETITTVGGTVLVQADFTAAVEKAGVDKQFDAYVRIYRDTTLIRNQYAAGRFPYNYDGLNYFTVGIRSFSVTETDTPSAGTYTYKVQMKWKNSGSATITSGVAYMRSMVLTELKK